MAVDPHPRWPSATFAIVAVTAFGAFMSFWAGCGFLIVTAIRHLFAGCAS